MPASIWGADTDVIQLGTFKPTEVERLKQQCSEELSIVPLLDRDNEEDGIDQLTAAVGLNVVSTLLHADLFHLKPELRLLAFFGHGVQNEQLCNALATSADPRRAKDTFLIKFNVEGISDLKVFIERCIARMDEATRRQLPGMGAATSSLMATSQCLQLAVELIFLHEVAHVVRNHLGQEAGFIEVPNTRRALETDADLAAAVILDRLLKEHAGGKPPPGADPKPASSWWLCAHLASFSLFSVLGENGPLKDGYYHTEFTRLALIVEQLKLDDNSKASGLLPAIIHEFKALNLVPEEHSDGEETLRDDIHELYTVTVPLLKQYYAEGRFDRWQRPKVT